MRVLRFLSLIALAGTSACWLPGFALGNVNPEPSDAAPVAKIGTQPKARKTPKNRQISSYYQRLQAEVFGKLRPVTRDEPVDFDEAATLLKSIKTTNEKIFNKNFESKMRDQYAGRVAPFEKAATDPIWRPEYWKVQRYEDGRRDVARWVTREVVEDQLKDFFNGGDKDSAAMKALATARALSGGEEEKPAEPKLTPQQKIARAHRTDLPPPPSDEEEHIPTRLKTKLNVLRQNGSVVFTNPVATTTLSGNRDDVTLNMNRAFRKISLSSNVGYTMSQECLNVNVSKKVAEHVSLDLDHYSYTGDKRGGSGEKVREQARVNYSVSF